MRVMVNRIRRLADLPPLPERGEGREQPIPGVVIELDRTLSGLWVRSLPGIFTLLAGALAASGPLWWTITAVAAIAVVAWPRGAIGQAFVGLCGLALLQGPDLTAPAVGGGMAGAMVGRLAVLLLVVHLLLRAAALATHVPWDGQVEAGVIGRAARSVLGTQAVVQVLLALVVWVRAQVLPGLAGVSGLAAQEWLRLVAMVAVVAATALLVPRSWVRRED